MRNVYTLNLRELTFEFIFLHILEHLYEVPRGLGEWPAVLQHLSLDDVLVGLKQTQDATSSLNSSTLVTQSLNG